MLLQVLSLDLDSEDLAAIGAVLEQAQGPRGDVYSFERGG
jgi:hypothetical protein